MPQAFQERLIRLASGVWRLASGVWRLASGVWRLASGVWRLAGPRSDLAATLSRSHVPRGNAAFFT
ncbi:hypothetical protein [Parathalassolituus penaei]|uniref:Uncharacterized protein n=1 Tax=Parathalassolituus penaei TaxID=2997323 RepID=A0A9X3EB90_9GAMM|nr:hypothetical protein [Parathalassolituus penaei]MCY0964016.1 hypothetical protein [Parathalassolituus penaei]